MEAADESKASALEEEALVHKAMEDLVFLKRFIPQNVGEDLNPGQEVCSVQGNVGRASVDCALKGDPPKGREMRQCWLRTPDGPQPCCLYRKCNY